MSHTGKRKDRSIAPSEKTKIAVSDEDALKALLDEAGRKEREKKADERKGKRFHSDKKVHDWSKEASQEYYGPARGMRRSSSPAEEDSEAKQRPQEKLKPDFGLSGALAGGTSGKGGGNMYKGVLLKFQEPPDARTPNTQWRFYVFKGEEQIQTLHVSKQSAYLWGRNEEIADIPLQHPSCSSQHAVLQYRAVPNKETGKMSCQPYLMDLESTNGSFINGVRIDPARYYQLKKGDVLKFGASTREYVLLSANAKNI
jgi:smad nuclear-interacting protein 1